MNATFSRRGALALGLSGAAMAARGSPIESIVGPSRPLFELLDNAAWIPGGPANERHVYVIGAPWCSYCKLMHMATKAFSEQVQFRWIMAYSRDSTSLKQNEVLAYRRDAGDLDRVYNRNPINLDVPEYAYWGERWNDGVLTNLEKTLLIGFMTPVYFRISKRDGGAKTGHGFGSRDFFSDGWLSDVAPRPTMKDFIPKSTAIYQTVATRKSIPPVQVSVGAAGQAVYAAPGLDAPTVRRLDPGTSLVVDHIAILQDGSNWARVMSKAKPGGFPDRELWVPVS